MRTVDEWSKGPPFDPGSCTWPHQEVVKTVLNPGVCYFRTMSPGRRVTMRMVRAYGDLTPKTHIYTQAAGILFIEIPSSHIQSQDSLILPYQSTNIKRHNAIYILPHPSSTPRPRGP
jgi:hypothetical protein